MTNSTAHGDPISYRPGKDGSLPAVGHPDGVTAKGSRITRPDGSSVQGDVKPVKVDTDPDRADRYDTAGRYAQITSDGKHLIVANNESELDDMLRDYENSRGEVGKLVADNGGNPERDLGLSVWRRYDRDRTYVNNWHAAVGFEFETYKSSGRPAWATIDGEGISNTRADELLGGKVWVDNVTGQLHVKAGGDELPAKTIAGRLIPELERQLGHPITYPPRKNAPRLKRPTMSHEPGEPFTWAHLQHGEELLGQSHEFTTGRYVVISEPDGYTVRRSPGPKVFRADTLEEVRAELYKRNSIHRVLHSVLYTSVLVGSGERSPEERQRNLTKLDSDTLQAALQHPSAKERGLNDSKLEIAWRNAREELQRRGITPQDI